MKSTIILEFLAIVRKTVHGKQMSDKELLALLYLDEGYIDSFQLVEFIAAIEHHFKIKFSADELTSARFRTFKGVAEIIEENRSKKK